MNRLAMMFACSTMLVDVAAFEPHLPAPTATIAMARVARATTRHRGVTPRAVRGAPHYLGTRRLATVAAPIAS